MISLVRYLSTGIPSRVRVVTTSVHDRLKSVLGLETRVTLVEPKSLERFQGKAKRILDLRNQPEESSRL